jgi:hypothetical protein
VTNMGGSLYRARTQRKGLVANGIR